MIAVVASSIYAAVESVYGSRPILYNRWMLYVGLSILVALNLLWLMLVLFGLPGNWLMVLTTSLFAWWMWNRRPFSGGLLIAIAVLAAAGELIEFLGGAVGARRAGASWRASFVGILGAMVGALVGTVTFPVLFVGTIVGACLGVALAVWLVETSRGEHPELSLQRAVGAGVGEFLGLLSKFAVGVVIWLTIAIAAFWP
jgi:uncharacterized protein YqgC (DUF456 family)